MAQVFQIVETRDTPEVLFDFESGQCRIAGKSFPENAEKFYRPVIDWLEHYASTAQPLADPVHVKFAMHYINSSSVFALLELISTMKKVADVGNSVEVRWLYDADDDDIRRIGEDYQRLTELNFELVALKED